MRIGDDAVAVADDEMPRRGPNVDAVVRVCRMPDDAFVLFEECVHRSPAERHPSAQISRESGECDVLPRGVGDLAPTGHQGVPLHLAEFAVLGASVLGDQDAVADVVDGEVGDGVAARFVEQEHVLTVGDPSSP